MSAFDQMNNYWLNNGSNLDYRGRLDIWKYKGYKSPFHESSSYGG